MRRVLSKAPVFLSVSTISWNLGVKKASGGREKQQEKQQEGGKSVLMGGAIACGGQFETAGKRSGEGALVGKSEGGGQV